MQVSDIKVRANGVVQVQMINTVTQSFHRKIIVPGQSTEGEDPEVQAKCREAHTPEVVAKYQAGVKP